MNTIVKASFNGCTIQQRETFKDSHCLLSISVGQPAHESIKLEATLNLINRHFKKCTIHVSDTLQRYNFKLRNYSLPFSECHNICLLEGTNWLNRNKDFFSLLQIPYDIIRWDHWLLDNDYKTHLSIIEKLYNEDIDYKSAINTNIKEYLARQIFDNQSVNDEQAFTLCLQYLQEECAVMIMWIRNNYNFEVYPNPRNQAMATTCTKLIEPLHPKLLQSVSLRFKKNRQNI